MDTTRSNSNIQKLPVTFKDFILSREWKSAPVQKLQAKMKEDKNHE